MYAAFSGEGGAADTIWFCYSGYSAPTGENMIQKFVDEMQITT